MPESARLPGLRGRGDGFDERHTTLLSTALAVLCTVWFAGHSINDVGWALPDAERLPALSRGGAEGGAGRFANGLDGPVDSRRDSGKNKGMMTGDLTVSLCL